MKTVYCNIKADILVGIWIGQKEQLAASLLSCCDLSVLLVRLYVTSNQKGNNRKPKLQCICGYSGCSIMEWPAASLLSTCDLSV